MRTPLAAASALLFAALAAILLLVATPSSAQPANPPTETFDIDYVPGQKKYAAWRPRYDIKIFRTAGPILFTNPDGNVPVNVTAPPGSLLLLGGTSDVWISMNGFNWYIVAGPAAATFSYIPTAWKTTYTFEDGQSVCKERNSDRIYIMRDNRLWVSDDARTFTRYTATGVPNRWYYPSVVDNQNTIYSIAGDSTYASTDRGLTWSWRSNFVWSNTNRAGHFAEHYYSPLLGKSLIYAMGGGRPSNNDVWVTSDGAVTWTLLSSTAGWPARFDARLGVADNGVLIVAAGRPNDWDVFNDVWVSVDGGYNWWVLRNYATFTPRILPAVIVDSSGYYWIFGGAQMIYVEDVVQTSFTNSIVRSSHSFNDVLSWMPKVNRQFYGPIQACLGLACWPNSACSPGCALLGDFNFRAYAPGPFAPRSVINLHQITSPLTYRAVVNGVRSDVVAPAGSIIMYGGVTPWVNGVNTVDGWILHGSDVTTAVWRPLYGTGANASGLIEGVDHSTPQQGDGQFGCGESTDTGATLYLIGGGVPVQRSTNGGRTWTSLSTQIGWISWSTCVVLPRSHQVLTFNWDTAFVSTDAGATFNAVTTGRPGGRVAQASVAYYSSQLQTEVVYIIGGAWGWNHNLNDVLISLDAGVTFKIVTGNAAWSPRADARAVVHSSGVLAIFAGQSGFFTDWFNDAWFSADGGYRWYELTSSDAVTPRSYPGVVLTTDGLIVSIGGNREVGWLSNDIYISESTYRITESVLNWGAEVAPPFAIFKPTSGCIGLACAPNVTNCACRPSSQLNLLPTGFQGAWSVRFANAVNRLTNSHTYRVIKNGAETNLVMPSNSWVQFGGGLNDVWVSSDKGRTWDQIAGPDLVGSVPSRFQDSFTSREGQAYCTTPFDDTIYALGGKAYGDGSATAWSREVWRSTDGQDWIIAQEESVDGDLVWPGRAYLMCVIDSNLALYASGGNNDQYVQVDESTYVSADGGYTWDKVKTNGTYPGRAAFSGGAAWGRLLGKTLIYAMAGVGYRNFNDVWVTSNGAKSWALVSGAAPWLPRGDTYVAFADDGAMVLHGGQSQWFDHWYSDIWMSLDGGYNWWEVTPNHGALPRTFAPSIIDEQGYLYVFGGNVVWAWSNEVLRSTLSFSKSAVTSWGRDLVPNIVIPQEFGLACWPGLGSSACRYTVIPVAPPVSVVTSSSSTGGVSSAAAASSSAALSGGSIAGIVIGVLVGVIAAFVIGIFLGSLFARRGSKNAKGHSSSFQPHQDVELEASRTESRTTDSHA